MDLTLVIGTSFSRRKLTNFFPSKRLTLPAAVMRQNPGLARYQGRAVIAGIRPEHLVDLAFVALTSGLPENTDLRHVTDNLDNTHNGDDATPNNVAERKENP